MTLKIACVAIGGRIFLGKLNKEGTEFVGSKQDVTSDCLKAVLEKIGADKTHVITADGVPAYEIHVRRVDSRQATLDLVAPTKTSEANPQQTQDSSGLGADYSEDKGPT